MSTDLEFQQLNFTFLVLRVNKKAIFFSLSNHMTLTVCHETITHKGNIHSFPKAFLTVFFHCKEPIANYSPLNNLWLIILVWKRTISWVLPSPWQILWMQCKCLVYP